MIRHLRRAVLLFAYQTAVVLGILLMPLALALRSAGVRLPVGSPIESLRAAYARTAAE